MPPEQQLYWFGMYVALFAAWLIAGKRRRWYPRKPFFVEPTLETLFGLVTMVSGIIAVTTMASLATGALAMFAGLYIVSEGSGKFAEARKQWKYETELEQYSTIKPGRLDWFHWLQGKYRAWQTEWSLREQNAFLQRETLRQKARILAEAAVAAENEARQKLEEDQNEDSVAVGLPE
jgi:hypothetical protein